MPSTVSDRVAAAAARVTGPALNRRAHVAAMRAKGLAPAHLVDKRPNLSTRPPAIGTFRARAKPEPHSRAAAIVAVPADPDRLAVAGGMAAEKLHCTLFFLGPDEAALGPAVHDAALEACTLAAEMHVGGFEATVVGYGVLGSETPPATVLYLQAPELLDVHASVLGELDAAVGLTALAPQHPGWVPHLTLGYGLAVKHAAALHGTKIRFDRLGVLRAGNVELIPMAAATRASNAIGTFAAPPAPATPAEGDVALVAAGLCVRATDTGRVLMLQRSIEDDTDPAAGTWEFPGGKIEPDEDAFDAAKREWSEEVGQPAPEVDPTTTWTSPDGVYIGFVVDVPDESIVPINADAHERSVLNPDDPDGDLIEVACWWNPADLPDMPALRQELKDCPGWKDALGLPSDNATQEAAMTTTELATADEAVEGATVDLPDGTSGVIVGVHEEGTIQMPDGTTQEATPEDPALQVDLGDGTIVAVLASAVTVTAPPDPGGAPGSPPAPAPGAPAPAPAGGASLATADQVAVGITVTWADDDGDYTQGTVVDIATDGDATLPDGTTVTATPDDPVLTIEVTQDTGGDTPPTGDAPAVEQVQLPASAVEVVDTGEDVIDSNKPGEMAAGDHAYVDTNGDGVCDVCGMPEDQHTGAPQAAQLAATETTFAVQADGAWEGVLIVEGAPSGDGRQIQANALTWRTLPLPLMVMFRNPEGGGSGHDAAEWAGSIEWVERREGSTQGVFEIWGGGHLRELDVENSPGQRAYRMMLPGEGGSPPMLRGVSADLDKVEVEFENPEPSIDAPIDEQLGWDPGLMLVAAGRIMGATLCPFPAFEEAYVYLLDGADPQVAEDASPDAEPVVASAGFAAIVASLGPAMEGATARVWLPCSETSALVASAGRIPNEPPAAWFEVTPHDEAYPVRVEADGRVHGYVATWDACHIAFQNRCQPPPRSPSNYRALCNKQTLTAEGMMVATTPIFMDTVHPSLRLQASDAQAFYAHTGCAVADVAAYDTKHGIYVAGAARASASPEQLRAFRGSDVSPDWRPIQRGRLDAVALLCVNTSGFITEAALVASAGGDDDLAAAFVNSIRPGNARMRFDAESGEPLALVAAGMMRHNDRVAVVGELAALRADIEMLQRQLAPIRVERARARLTAARPITT